MHHNGLYGLSAACSNRINMSQMKKDQEMKRGDYQCKFYNHIACIIWYDSKVVMLLGSHLEERTLISTVQRRLKGSPSEIPVNWPHGMRSAYQVNQRSKFRFYRHLIFDLFNVNLVNFFIVYKKLENKDLTLKE